MRRQSGALGCGLVGGLLFATAVACSSSSSGGGGAPSCNYGMAASCVGGAKFGYCTTGSSSSSCTSAYYTVGSQHFPCASCSTADLAVCAAAATNACLGDAGGSSGGDATAD